MESNKCRNYMEELNNLTNQLENLRYELEMIQLLKTNSKRNSDLEFLVLKKENLKFRIDPNLNHLRPHFHVDFGEKRHTLSVCILTQKVLAGNIPSKYFDIIIDWAKKNEKLLLKIWKELRNHKDPTPLLIELK